MTPYPALRWAGKDPKPACGWGLRISGGIGWVVETLLADNCKGSSPPTAAVEGAPGGDEEIGGDWTTFSPDGV